jgi:2-keto-4-pentenoate hydratase
VAANFGATSQVEADFLVRVRSARINQAGRDHLAILRELTEVIPYVELPDLGLTGGVTGPQLLAGNVGARLGVLGRPIPVQATQAFADALQNMTVTTTDDTGRQLAQAPGRAVLGHPLNAVAFLIEDLAKQGKRLEAGQMLSIAGYSPPMNVQPGRTYTVTYTGLVAEPVAVSVRVR